MSDHDIEIVKQYFKQDQFARENGIELVSIERGKATARMQITEKHYNAFGIAHGGALFSLADIAFAAAANTHGVVSLSISVTMSYIKARSNGVLTAYAYEVSSSRKLGTYRVDIKDEEDKIVAIFEGMVYRKEDKLKDCIR